MSHETLIEIVRTSPKCRFAVSDDGRRIRASQGHTVEVDLQLPPETPPEILFHGTASRFLSSIRREGLRRMGRHHVHLSADERTALAVGSRHGRPVVLETAAGAMHRAGTTFRRSQNGVWLAEEIPVEFIVFPRG